MNFGPSHKTPPAPILGKTIYFLGVASDGPVNEPVKVNDINYAIKVFGPLNTSPITRAYAQYYQSGGVTATLVRIIGTQASRTIYGDTQDATDIEVLNILAIKPGSAGNDIVITVDADGLVISYPLPDGSLGSAYYDYATYDTVSFLCKAINSDAASIVIAEPIEPDALTSTMYTRNVTNITLTYGDDNLTATKNELYYALANTLDILEGLHIDIIVPVEMYVDDVKPLDYIDEQAYGNMYYVANRDYLDIIDDYNKPFGYHKLMIDFGKRQMLLGMVTHCIMGMNPLPNPLPTDYQSTVAIALASPIGTGDGFRVWQQGDWYDFGHYITIVYGDYTYFPNSIDEFVACWYASYAALWINSGYNESTTGLPLTGGINVQDFNDQTIRDLTSLGIVTYKFSPLRGWCVSAGITQAFTINALYFSVNIKIVQRVLSMIVADIDAYLDNPGEPIMTQQSLSKVLDASLTDRKDTDKIISNYDYTVSYTESLKLLTVDLTLYTPFTVEQIVASASVPLKVG